MKQHWQISIWLGALWSLFLVAILAPVSPAVAAPASSTKENAICVIANTFNRRLVPGVMHTATAFAVEASTSTASSRRVAARRRISSTVSLRVTLPAIRAVARPGCPVSRRRSA